jgi:N-acetylglucosamine-6-phosphate deacetylase
VEVFMGKYDPSKMTFMQKLFNGFKPIDNRDMGVVRAWAAGLAGLAGLAGAAEKIIN